MTVGRSHWICFWDTLQMDGPGFGGRFFAPEVRDPEPRRFSWLSSQEGRKQLRDIHSELRIIGVRATSRPAAATSSGRGLAHYIRITG